MMVILNLTEDEAVGLNRLIDLAVRQGGLQVAATAAALNQKLVESIRLAQKPNGSAEAALTQ